MHRDVLEINLVLGTSVDWEVSLQVTSSGPSHALPPGWYVVDPGTGSDVTGTGSSGLLGNVPVNGLDEWDVNKLGWFKFRQTSGSAHDGVDHMETGHQIRQAFSATVENCQENRHTFKVSSV